MKGRGTLDEENIAVRVVLTVVTALLMQDVSSAATTGSLSLLPDAQGSKLLGASYTAAKPIHFFGASVE